MKKSVIDLTAAELEKLASEAWFKASDRALKSGVAVAGREGSKIVRTYPDGRVESLGDAKPLVAGELVSKKPRPGRARRSA
jgi:hypothetical protein